MKTLEVPVAEMKRHFADYIAQSAHAGCRIIVKRRNRPVAALVSLEDYSQLEQFDKRHGLVSLVGKWRGFDEITEDVLSARKQGGEGRNVSL
ncbi:MAG: type II toxin-antitoxin system Phd/YefM family antitoxin [Spartobacteria bacterium]|nr:type II toxin-antitoxin system Phd/YefM family antitoxin [Spartobacteria bacterium]